MTLGLIHELQMEVDRAKQRLSDARHREPFETVGEYAFVNAFAQSITLRDLFGARSDLLVIHNTGSRFAYCTMWADGLNGLAEHLLNRTQIVITTPDEPERAQRFAASRGWRLPVVSLAESPFARDMGFQLPTNQFLPGVSAFTMTPTGSVLRTGNAHFGPGDDFCPAWSLFDLLAGGAGTWGPRNMYDDRISGGDENGAPDAIS